jgi:UV DNA damage endonuclease
MQNRKSGIRWGLCCLFREEPIRFAVRQATHLARFDRSFQLALLSATLLANGQALLAAITYCGNNGIESFPVNSRIFPLKTHPTIGYRMTDLPNHAAIERLCRQAGSAPTSSPCTEVGRMATKKRHSED